MKGLYQRSTLEAARHFAAHGVRIKRPKRAPIYRVHQQPVEWAATADQECRPIGDTDIVKNYLTYGTIPRHQRRTGFKDPRDEFVTPQGGAGAFMPTYSATRNFLREQYLNLVKHPPSKFTERSPTSSPTSQPPTSTSQDFGATSPTSPITPAESSPKSPGFPLKPLKSTSPANRNSPSRSKLRTPSPGIARMRFTKDSADKDSSVKADLELAARTKYPRPIKPKPGLGRLLASSELEEPDEPTLDLVGDELDWWLKNALKEEQAGLLARGIFPMSLISHLLYHNWTQAEVTQATANLEARLDRLGIDLSQNKSVGEDTLT